MASIPLPALGLQPVQQPDTLQKYGQLLALKNAQQQQALMQQEAPLRLQALQQQVETGRQDLAAREALNQAYSGAVTKDESGNPTIDANKLAQGLAGGPAAYKTPEVMKGITDFQKSRLELQSTATGLQEKTADMLGSAGVAIRAANYDPTLAHSLLDSLPQSPQLNQIRQQIDNPQALKQLVDSAIQNSPAQQKMLNEQNVARIRANTPEAQEMNSWLEQQNKGLKPGDPGYKIPADYAQHKVDMESQAVIGRETDPRVIKAKEQVSASEAATRLALAQGDPKAAAQLLVNGELTLGELKTRGLTPDFIAKTLFEAHRLSGGTYNAQQAEAQFDVARSPANVAFFGSAKSLTDKGGTLDQLAEAGKQIPGGQIPVFNSIADWEKAAAGSGPIAKYAALALGVADDYSKVMGGGQGSDSSRTQALNLIGAKQSPEQRAASLQGIRGAVESQTNSRIGNNPVLKRMYGSESGSQPSSGGISVGSVITQNGHRYKVTAVDKNGKPTAADPVQ